MESITEKENNIFFIPPFSFPRKRKVIKCKQHIFFIILNEYNGRRIEERRNKRANERMKEIRIDGNKCIPVRENLENHVRRILL